MNSTVKLLSVFLAVGCAIVLAVWVGQPWFEPITLSGQCQLPDYVVLQQETTDAQSFRTCLEQNAKLFLEKDYTEAKELAKTFFTLLSAALIASITFSEKIVDIHNARRTPLLAMLGCWLLLVLCILLTGGGLAGMAVAAELAAYHPIANYFHIELHSLKLFMFALIGFGAALVLLIVAGAVSLSDKRSAALSVALSARTKHATESAVDSSSTDEKELPRDRGAA